MSTGKLKTALVGFGRIAQGYANDPVMAQKMRYATHAQVLSGHPRFSWVALVDHSATALDSARQHYSFLEVAQQAEELSCCSDIEVLVIATPPGKRLALLAAFPNLKAVLVEKPLGDDLEQAFKLVEACRMRQILLQVNLMRRADIFTRELAFGDLARMIGSAQAAFGIYGNGLLNNGSHMIDLVRMLLGDIETAQAITGFKPFVEGPLPSDSNPAFVLSMVSGITVMMQPVRFSHYRENCLDIWGDCGRFAYMHGGVTLLQYPLSGSRLINGEKEIVVDCPRLHPATLGTAIYEMYNNLAEAVDREANLMSSGQSALETACMVQAVLNSARENGRTIHRHDVLSYLNQDKQSSSAR